MGLETNRKSLLLQALAAGLLFCLFISQLALGGAYEKLSEEKLKKLLNQHCTLVLPWASWCDFCLQELPELLPALNHESRIHPLVLDLSRPYVQQHFSKPFMDKLSLTYPTYRIPMESDEPRYRKQIDPKWEGQLPIAALFTCSGQKCGLKHRWDAKLSPQQIPEIVGMCSEPKGEAPKDKKSK